MATETRFEKLFGVGSGTGSRPAFGNAGARWIDTTGPTETYDSGAAWVALGGGGGGSGLYSALLIYQDQKATNTAGGTATSGAWRTRDLNTEVVDTGNNGTLSANQITLLAGTYDVLAFAPGNGVSRHQARLYNITDSAVLLSGQTSYNAGDMGQSVVNGRFTIAASKVIELQHQVQTTVSTVGFGVQAGASFTVSNEIYSVLILWKV